MNYVLQIIMGCFSQVCRWWMRGPPCFALSISVSQNLQRDRPGLHPTDPPCGIRHTIQSHGCIIHEGQTLVGRGGLRAGLITWCFIFNEVNGSFQVTWNPAHGHGRWSLSPAGVLRLLLALTPITVTVCAVSLDLMCFADTQGMQLFSFVCFPFISIRFLGQTCCDWCQTGGCYRKHLGEGTSSEGDNGSYEGSCANVSIHISVDVFH